MFFFSPFFLTAHPSLMTLSAIHHRPSMRVTPVKNSVCVCVCHGALVYSTFKVTAFKGIIPQSAYDILFSRKSPQTFITANTHRASQLLGIGGKCCHSFLKGFPWLDMLEMTFWFTGGGEWEKEWRRETQKWRGRAAKFVS